jgi:hypothetical protein
MITSSLSLRDLPVRRSVALASMAALLAVADWLPANEWVDPDKLQFALTGAIGLSAIALSLRDRLDVTAIVRWRNRAILCLITIVLSLALAEPMTRFIFRDVTTVADAGGFFSRRWYGGDVVHRNAAGFRERPFSVDKPAGTYRIAIVGDSFTYGNGVRQQDRYSDLLHAKLPDHIEVLNFGAGGANTPEHRNLIARLLPEVHPDFVLLQWYVNDTEDDDSTGRPSFYPLAPVPSLHQWLNDSSALYTIANMQWAETQVALGMTVSYTEYLQRRLGDPNSHDSQLERHLMLDLIALCRRANVPIGIVLFPDTARPDFGSGYPFGYLHERVLDICREQNLVCVDLRDAFSKVKDHRLLWASRLDHHPSALANEIAAVKIFETYAKEWAASPIR